MTDTDPISRRTIIKMTGVAGLTAAIAGCSDDGGGGPGEEGNEGTEDPAEEESPAGGNETEEESPGGGNETEDNETEDNETEDNESEEDGAMDEEGGGAIEPDTQIVLEAETSGWVGAEPDEIADDENPTITLEEDESYEIGWEEGDGGQHNIELVDDEDEVVEDYETDPSQEGGEDQFIEFDATDEIAEYVCRPHENTMRGEIDVQSGGGGGGEDEENATDENATDENATEEDGNESDDNESDE